MNRCAPPRLLACLLVWLCLGLVGCEARESRAAPAARAGALELSDWSFADDGPVPLRGEWEFFRGTLLQPADFEAESRQGEFVGVPGIWTQYPEPYPAAGFATYRLRLRLPDGELPPLAIFNEGQGSSYRLWVNGELLAEDGVVAATAAESTPSKRFGTVFFTPRSAELDLVVQIANFHHVKAGFRNELLLGAAADIHRWQRETWLGNATLFGAMLIVGLYHLCLFAYRREDPSYLWFGTLMITLALRAGITSQNVLLWLLPEGAWAPLLRLEYVTFFFGIVLYTAFLRSLYPEEVKRQLLVAMAVVAAGFSLLAITADTMFASRLIPFYQILWVIYLLVLMWMVVLIWLRKRPYSSLILAASAVSALSNLVEVLYLQGYLPFGKVAVAGFVFFLFLQAVVLAGRFARTHERAAQLGTDLEAQNVRLQQSERKYRTLFEDAHDVIFITDPAGRIEDVNPACRDVLGYAPDDLVGVEAFDELVVHQDRHRFDELMLANDGVAAFATEFVHRDGSHVPVLVSAKVRRDADGAAAGHQAYVRSISDQLEASAQRERAERLEMVAALDPLTRIFNRRYFDQVASVEMARASRQGSELILVMMDLDHFKRVNDEHGHLTGDDVLVRFARCAQDNIRATDILARFGGEEFVLVMTETSAAHALERMEQLRAQIAELVLEDREGGRFSITVSMGLAAWDRQESLEDLLERADRALYQSKEGGRDRVTLAAGGEAPPSEQA